ncbi:MAG: hypothetical protein U9Q05_14450 [Thermodesulfobacteriota bacterium]|nr:hypothetical protein [Thermodesulfobacteriota bacterium]
MKKISITLLFSVIFFLSSLSFASDLSVGGVRQVHPDEKTESHIGLGWGHRSMTYGMMNLMTGMTSQIAKIIRSEKASPLMMKKSAEILDHIAEMMNYAPAYMMGTKVVDSKMVNEMHNMLKDIEKMRKELDL